MLDHPALNWLRQHPRLFALIGSLLIAGYVLSLGERPNDDAYTYVRVADILLHDGLAAAYAYYPWATYSVYSRILFSSTSTCLPEAACSMRFSMHCWR